MPVRVAVTAGTAADCTQAALIDGIAVQFLLADLGYDSNEITIETGCEIVIPPKGIVRHSVAMIRLFIE